MLIMSTCTAARAGSVGTRTSRRWAVRMHATWSERALGASCGIEPATDVEMPSEMAVVLTGPSIPSQASSASASTTAAAGSNASASFRALSTIIFLSSVP